MQSKMINKWSILQNLYDQRVKGKRSCALIVQGDEEVQEFNKAVSELIKAKYITEVISLFPPARAFEITELGIGAIWFGFEEADKILTLA